MPKAPSTYTTDFQNVCTMLAEHMQNLSGEDLAELANKVLTVIVTYEGDSIFTINEESV